MFAYRALTLALAPVALLAFCADTPASSQLGQAVTGSPSPCVSGDARSDNEAWTTRSWTRLNAGDFKGAVDNVGACAANWSEAAAQSQADMDQKHLECPPVGAVDSVTQAQINRNGPLNDVATNDFILGSAYEGLGDRRAANAAFQACARLRCARTWDARGWFWDTAAACRARLAAVG